MLRPERSGSPRRRRWRIAGRLRSALLLAVIPGVLGIALVRWPPSASLEKSGGLDTLFRLRGPRTPPPGVCVVAIDDDSYGVIGRDASAAWPRGLHAELLRSLARAGARAVAFDVLFVDEGEDPAQDEALRRAIEETGFVVLGSSVEIVEDPRFTRAQILEPYAPFASAAAAVADVNLPTDGDGVIRFAWPSREGRPGLALAAWETATGERGPRDSDSRLLDYYGPARTIPTVSVYQALDPGHYLPPGFFEGKIVFVGASQGAAIGLAAKDAFLTPFRGGSGGMTFGVEIHATLAANLIEAREIRLLDRRLEALLLLVLPLVASLTFMAMGPLAGGAAFLGLLLGPWIAAQAAFGRTLWIPTVIPSTVQLPLSYGLSLIWYYLTTVREREKIKRAFGHYLAPEMIRRIAHDPDALDLGGHETVGTAMFTDIKGFTPIAERQSAPETAAMLNAYFSDVTRHVFESEGTLIKYIGDAVFAVWGAPLPMSDHATRACLTAVAIAGMRDPRLVTRIGLHTGPMLVGNLGSTQRFDYTAIGDAVNVAARLEGLNKAFGTRALASGDTLAATDGRFVTRALGRARVVGRREPIDLHELLGVRGATLSVPDATLDAFDRARSAFAERRFADAAAGFALARATAGGEDGPSVFFEALASRYAKEPPPEDWDGVVNFEIK